MMEEIDILVCRLRKWWMEWAVYDNFIHYEKCIDEEVLVKLLFHSGKFMTNPARVGKP